MDADTLDVQLFDGHIEAWRLVVATLLCWVITSLSVSAGGVMPVTVGARACCLRRGSFQRTTGVALMTSDSSTW